MVVEIAVIVAAVVVVAAVAGAVITVSAVVAVLAEVGRGGAGRRVIIGRAGQEGEDHEEK